MDQKFHERACCIAVMQSLERREGSKASGQFSPELAGDTGPVELAFDLAGRLHALEHTGIEPFSGFMRMDAEAKWRLAPIEDDVRPQVSREATFQLALPIGSLASQKGEALREVQTAIAEWVVAVAAKLLEPAPLHGSFRATSFQTTDTPIRMRLDRLSRSLPGKNFFIVHSTTEQSLEELRRSRLREALRKKLPKLQVWAERGARTLLILEDNDIAVTNETLVWESLAAIRSEYEFWPDEIYMASTFTEDFWAIHTLWLDDRGYFDLCEEVETRTTVDPKGLVAKIRGWDDFFDAPGLELPEREQRRAQERDGF